MMLNPFAEAVSELAQVLSRNQQRLISAQFEAYHSLLAGQKTAQQAAPQLDNTIEASNLLISAHVCAHNDLLQFSERWLGHWQRQVAQNAREGGAEEMIPAMTAGSTMIESLSRASRQINQFACTNMGAAAMRGVRSARAVLKQPPHR